MSCLLDGTLLVLSDPQQLELTQVEGRADRFWNPWRCGRIIGESGEPSFWATVEPEVNYSWSLLGLTSQYWVFASFLLAAEGLGP